MFRTWSKAIIPLSKFRLPLHQTYARVAAAAPAPTIEDKVQPLVNLDKLFWSKPCSLVLPPDSPLRVDEPDYQGFKRFMLKLMLFYSKQSKSIRGANVVYKRIVSQVDKPLIYEVFNLEKTFKTTFSLLVLHMWFYLRRIKQEGNDGVEFGQYLYEIYNHDVELRVSKAGVNLLLIKWMKELEKIFYGNIVAYDAAILPEAKPGDFATVIWRNIFSDDGSSTPDEAAWQSVQYNNIDTEIKFLYRHWPDMLDGKLKSEEIPISLQGSHGQTFPEGF
ncbi:ubiquinol-cytochrome c reductase complex chaperone CBP3-like protein [Trifolium pratense]|uniref:Ubiquinol-cytochrome c reductase complex chaperone CBP3-like protein n=2 Tax=Trifolium TaxID=3898 RepID=A0A2K3NXF6_TRIPR|nr:ubiquinol-cytochrome c reductase complex chaperone CBP3-like protein [Trifolium pratense]